MTIWPLLECSHQSSTRPDICEAEGYKLRIVLGTMRKHKLYAKKKKCSFLKRQIEYLGFIVSAKGISVDPAAKVKYVLEWPSPTSVKEIRSFLGLTVWYRIFIKDFETMDSSSSMKKQT